MFRDADYHIPIVHCTNDDWSGWISLNGDPSLVSDYASEAKSPETWENRLYGAAGEFIDLEPALEPDWYNREYHWEGWIPTETLIEPTPWYHEMMTTFPYATVNSEYFITQEQQKTCQDTYRIVDSCIHEITESDLFPDGSPKPRPFDLESLTRGYRSMIELQKVGAASKRGLLSRLGFIAWWITAVPKWDELISEETVNHVKSLRPRYGKKRGYLIDFKEYWREINVPLLLGNNIDIYYLWTWNMKIDAKFAKLDPRLIMKLGDEENNEAVNLYDVGEFNVKVVKQRAEMFDDYFQPLEDKDSDAESSLTHGCTNAAVIDFHGWGARPISIDPTFRDTITSSYKYTTATLPHENYPRIIIWRWRKKEESQFETLPIWLSGNDAFGEEIEIRERFKGTLAPIPGRREFNLYSGGLKTAVSGMSLLTRLGERSPYKVFHQPEVPPGPPSLLERLSAVPMGSVGVQIRFDTSTIEGQSSTDDSDFTTNVRSTRSNDRRIASSSSMRRERSKSPISTRFNPPPMERGAETFRRVFTEIDTLMAPHLPAPQFVDNSRWNPTYLDVGYLIVRGWNNQARMRLAANTIPSMKNIRDVLTFAINHGLEFQIGITHEHFAKFHPRILSTWERSGVKNYYAAGYSDEPFSTAKGKTFVVLYLGRLSDLLNRPHAIAFISLGGPFSWVARHHGGIEIVHRYMSGPSIQVTRHSRGGNDSDESTFLGLHWDEVSQREQETLLGFVPGTNGGADKWMYPPPEILKLGCRHWSGIWNQAMEDIFTYIARSVDNKTAVPLSKTEWLHALRPFNTRRPSYQLTEENVEEIRLVCERFASPINWDRVALSSLKVPEYVQMR